MTSHCVYCNATTIHTECVAEAVYRQVKGQPRELVKAPQYVPVCHNHVPQVERSIINGRVVAHRRPKAMTGQTSIDDYLV